jgi:hypothetical protein
MATVTFQDSDVDTGGGTPSDFTALGIGSGDGSRTLFFGFFTVASADGITITGVTVDGETASAVIQQANNYTSGVTDVAAIFAISATDLPDPTVSDVDVEVTWSSSGPNNVYAMSFATADALDSLTPTDSQGSAPASGGTVTTLSLDVVDGGIIIGVCGANYSDATGAASAWVGLTEDLDQNGDTNYHWTCASASGQTAATPLTITETLSGGTSLAGHVGVAASFAPAASGAPEPSSRRMMQGRGGMTGGMQMRRRASGLYMPQHRLLRAA